MKFEVWAPRASSSVELILDDERHPMTSGDSGWWEAEVNAPNGTRYAYSLDGGPSRTDPRALRMPDGPDAPGAIFDLGQVAWTDDAWRGLTLAGAVIYEVHVGTFTPQGTLDAAVLKLDHLVALGVDVVELMPIATFPGRRGWGYDGVGLYAVHEAYGGPAALCRFVDECHARGLGVCLDVVYNHLGPSGNYLSDFGPYFTDKYGTPWGAALNLDGPDSDPVRDFIIDNAVMWLRDFHVDGLRLDAVHELFDDRAITLLEGLSSEVSAMATRLGRQTWLIAESDRNDPLTVTSREAGGLGLAAQWADDVHHGLHVALTGESDGYYFDFAQPGALTKVLESIFLHDGTYSTFRRRTHGRPVDRAMTPGWRFVVSLQTHDQVGNRALGERLSSLVSVGRLACGAALLLTCAGTPMLFMGEEYGAASPWQFFTDYADPALGDAVRNGRRAEFAGHGWAAKDIPDPQDPATFERSRLDWTELGEPDHARLLAWYSELIKLRRERPDLADPRLDRVEVAHDPDAQTIVVRRSDHFVVVNLSHDVRTIELPIEPDAQLELVARWIDTDELAGADVVRLSAESTAIVAIAT